MGRMVTGRNSNRRLLAHVRLTEIERREAEHYLELGERTADAILGAAAVLLSLLHAMERTLRSLGSRPTG